MAEAGQCCLGSRLHRDDCNLWESHSINQSYWAILGTCIHIWLFLCFYTCLSWFHHHICCSNHVISLIFVGAISSSWLHLPDALFLFLTSPFLLGILGIRYIHRFFLRLNGPQAVWRSTSRLRAMSLMWQMWQMHVSVLTKWLHKNAMRATYFHWISL